ncbi:Protein of unknown function [Sulfitobacter brevis]|uniref:DUF3726 domain-containing protein n=1 Tax=Sulfitobacter brevis TaxID=74348 RepID=A0A1I1XT60_9RHOB|nr:DUF3726 domain-containing protein [Sulfitobacter brevis]SFE10454.1 Protein of unknown function [Sulfitobacter brevis]
MIYSLNEIEALARKAARGSGLSWGLAEEAGKAVRWLCANGFQGTELLTKLLSANDGKPYSDLAPQQIDDVWRARSGMLCPIILGALICDRADELGRGEPIKVGEVAMPLMLAPFASHAARSAGVTVTLEWQGAKLTLDGGAPGVQGDEAALHAARTTSVTLSQTDAAIFRSVPTERGRQLTPEILKTLEAFAQRTYAPATEASRAGAGAETDDD